MPPFSEDQQDYHTPRRLSTKSSEFSPLKKHLSLIPERFISFQESVRVVPCENLSSDKADLWYSPSELQQFKAEAKTLARRSKQCLRGLELITSRGFQQATKNRLYALSVVLHLQYQGDPSLIPQAYSQVSLPCKDEAISNAMRDRVEADPFYDSREEEGDCTACFPLAPKWLSSLLSPRRRL